MQKFLPEQKESVKFHAKMKYLHANRIFMPFHLATLFMSHGFCILLIIALQHPGIIGGRV